MSSRTPYSVGLLRDCDGRRHGDATCRPTDDQRKPKRGHEIAGRGDPRIVLVESSRSCEPRPGLLRQMSGGEVLGHVGQHPHALLEAVFHHDHVDKAEIVGRARLPQPGFEWVLLWKLSRFGRDIEEGLIYRALLKKRGIELISFADL